MVTKKMSKEADETGRVKVRKLPLNKETVKDLTPGEKKQIGGGLSLATIGSIVKDIVRNPLPTTRCITIFECPSIACPTP